MARLEDRVDWGLEEGIVSEEQLATIADAATGNARDAIGILRTAAREAEHDTASKIRDEDIETAIPEAQAAVRQKAVQKLSAHQRVVYEVLEEAGPLSRKELYARYQSAVEEPRTKRTVRNYVGKLEQYNLINSHGRGPGRQYDVRVSVGSP